MINIYEAVSANKRKSVVVIIVFAIFVAITTYFISLAAGIYMGYEPGGLGFFGIALIISGLTSLGSYYYSDQIVLTISKARPANRKEHFNFYTASENLAIASGLPKPALYVIDDTAPNAFATGRNPKKAVICVTTGLLAKLTRTELEGVIAHEMTHIKNYDIRLMSVVSVMVGLIALLSDWFIRMSYYSKSGNKDEKNQLQAIVLLLGIIFAILSPIIAQLIKLAVSRRREFLADAGGVSITRQPDGLIKALRKIAEDKEPLEVANKATAHLYIENPFKQKPKGAVSWFSNLFNTHPPVEERIKALQEML